MGKIGDVLLEAKLKDLLKAKEESECSGILRKLFVAIGVITVVGLIAYVAYRYVAPDYLDEFDDDYEDEFEDDFEDEEFFAEEEPVQVN